MIARVVLSLLLVACSSSKQPPPPIDHTIDAGASETSAGPVASGCSPGVGGEDIYANSSTCYQSYTCPAGQYRADCACPQATCTCSAPDGTKYRTVAFDCDAGCDLSTSSGAAECGLSP